MSSDINLERIFGVAVREPHFSRFRDGENAFNSIEILTENFLFDHGERRNFLKELSGISFIHSHGTAANIGSTDPLDKKYFENLKRFIREFSVDLVSDHLCFTRQNQKSSFELLPVPMTLSMVDHIGRRVDQVRQMIGQDFLLENISRYFSYKLDEMDEVEFMAKLHDKHGVKFLLDVNNIYVSSRNLNLDWDAYLSGLPRNCVGGYHLGGFEMVEGFLFDTHGAKVVPEVSEIFAKSVDYFGFQPAFLERDSHIPEDLGELEIELSNLVGGLSNG
ncbi:MAG: DUF692 domain-containing protein [Bdellovibrionales bacterium]